jgi:hypothetical protein
VLKSFPFLYPQDANVWVQNQCATSVFLNKAAVASQNGEKHFYLQEDPLPHEGEAQGPLQPSTSSLLTGTDNGHNGIGAVLINFLLDCHSGTEVIS